MKKTLALVFIFLMLTAILPVSAGCGAVVAGSGETQTFELNYTNFSRLEIGAGFKMDIVKSETFFVSITIDKALYEYLNIAQRGDILHIGLKSNNIYTAALRTGTIKLPDIRRLELSAGAEAQVTGFISTHSVDFMLSGASRLTLDSIQAGDTSFDLSGGSTAEGAIQMNKGNLVASGGSTLTLTGSANEFKINASGGSKIEVQDVPVTTADVNLGGASRARITVSDILDIKLSGGSTLEYAGNPKIGNLNISGGSTFNQVTQ